MKLLDNWLCEQTDICLESIPDHDDNRNYTKKDKINNYRASAFIDVRLKLREILNK